MASFKRKIVGKYGILSEIGKGGIGEVYPPGTKLREKFVPPVEFTIGGSHSNNY